MARYLFGIVLALCVMTAAAVAWSETNRPAAQKPRAMMMSGVFCEEISQAEEFSRRYVALRVHQNLDEIVSVINFKAGRKVCVWRAQLVMKPTMLIKIIETSISEVAIYRVATMLGPRYIGVERFISKA